MNSAHDGMPKIVVIAVYFGTLPFYFPLWLHSCKQNPEFNWLVITDADTTAYSIPSNVRIRRSSLKTLEPIFQQAAGCTISLNSPYKLCDFKPLYWALLEDDTNCDFWGHCDIDLIFGSLKAFITPQLLDQHDKIFSVGHFTLYRNTKAVNTFFKHSHPDLDWRAILGNEKHLGFDEHLGVNKIWALHEGRQFIDEDLIADIEPNIGRFERSKGYWPREHRYQVFCYLDGNVLRLYWKDGRIVTETFMYIHFQKRRFQSSTLPENINCFFITQNGFLPMHNRLPGPEEMQSLNPVRMPPRLSEIIYRLRKFARAVKNRVIRGERPR